MHKTGAFDFFSGFFDSDNLRLFDSNEFKEDLRKSLYGQHIALETIVKSVTWFMKDPNPPKPLVLSLHGPTGVGKSYVTEIIARNIYQMGERSKHVHTFIATNHFSYYYLEQDEAQLIKQWIHGNVSSFPRSMFIFDRMDMISSHLINTIKPFLDYIPHIDGVSFRNAIFIFLSNAGGSAITNLTVDFWRKGKNREELQKSKEMETQIYQDIFNNKDSGFWHSCLIDRHLVDHFVPFLPLERKHVRQCVLAEMVILNMTSNHYLIDKVLMEMPFFPQHEEIFSVRGCHALKHNLMLYKYKKDIF
ncbi:torsin-1A-like [Triplophysa rosa]|uniref:torsin-1A-like n=1 Tax=Triplophysa rosa TaxID=992332 RepID=UPI00254636DA|nr:torsin-1A-like [Triplophysa rosa]